MFLRGKGKRSDGDDQSIIGDIPIRSPDSFKPQTLLLTEGDHFFTSDGLEKLGSFIPNSSFAHID